MIDLRPCSWRCWYSFLCWVILPAILIFPLPLKLYLIWFWILDLFMRKTLLVPSTFENVTQFTYLGSLVTQDNEPEDEVKRIIFMAYKCYFGLRKLFTPLLLFKQTNLHLFKTSVCPVLLYGSEIWMISKKIEQDIRVFKREILWRIFGGAHHDRN